MKFKEQIKELQRSIDEKRIRIKSLQCSAGHRLKSKSYAEIVKETIKEARAYIKLTREAIKVLREIK